MFRTLGYLIAVAALIGGSVWLADHPGMVTVRWLAWRADTTVPILVLVIALILIIGYFSLRFIFGILGLPTWFSRRSRERRHMKGSAALAGAVTAIASGDTEAAKRCMKDADRALQNQQLTHLLTAQIDEAKGDAEAAKAHFEALLETPETELAGLRGLIKALPQDDAQALTYAERALVRAPKAEWAIRAVYAAQFAAGRLDAAYATVAMAKKAANFTAEEKSELAMARAQVAQTEGRLADAAKLAAEALALAPDSVEALLTLVAIYRADGKQKKAAEALEKQWQVTPSAKILLAYLTLWDETDAADILKRVRKLVANNAEHPESRLAMADAFMMAENYSAAREVLIPVIGPDSTANVAARGALTMARIASVEGADAHTQKQWIERAAIGLSDA